jgi:hypothetical protein
MATRKRGVEHAEIVLPTEAAKCDMNWARDQQALWNAAEATRESLEFSGRAGVRISAAA